MFFNSKEMNTFWYIHTTEYSIKLYLKRKKPDTKENVF